MMPFKICYSMILLIHWANSVGCISQVAADGPRAQLTHKQQHLDEVNPRFYVALNMCNQIICIFPENSGNVCIP